MHIHSFKRVSCTLDISKATNEYGLHIYNDNDQHPLRLMREQIPITLVNIIAKLIKLIAQILAHFAIGEY